MNEIRRSSSFRPEGTAGTGVANVTTVSPGGSENRAV